VDPFTFGDRLVLLGLAEPDPVDAGWISRLRRGPVTIDGALALGLAAMLDEDDEERRQRDPVAYAPPRRRRTLLGRLLGR
jgi:hypothetical protein